MNYKDAGVSLQDQNMFNAKLCSKMPWLGGFGGVFPISDDHYLVSSTDGVGTKSKLYTDTKEMNIDTKLEHIGIDLVAMVFNDIVCTGAKPLFMNDYIAVNSLADNDMNLIIQGINSGLEQCRNAPLIAGETAIMGDVYQEGEFDIAGFGVGLVAKDSYIDGSGTKDGDVMLGLFSDGFHANGFSLIRKVMKRVPKEDIPTDLYKELLKPTRIYVEPILKMIEKFGADIHAIAHITGGGRDNVDRVIGGEAMNLRPHWHGNETPPEMFKFIQQQGVISDQEMLRVFNNGIGMVVIVERNKANDITQTLEAYGERVVEVGYIKERLTYSQQEILTKNAQKNLN